ncbi:MAG: M50 family metallopeptidase [Clostridia bacterium]|nr:M50 family metallopeptidase [Clostridia bacterium]
MTGRQARAEKEEKREKIISVSPFAAVPLAVFLFFSRDLTLPAALLAALLHECGHIAALYLAGGRLKRIRIGPFGGEILPDERILSYRQNLFVSFAGPAVNLLSAVFFCSSVPVLRLFGLCSAGIGLFNLVPVRGLDGGEILFSALCLILPLQTAELASKVVSAFFVSVLLIAGLVFCLQRTFCLSFLLPALYLFFCALMNARG